MNIREILEKLSGFFDMIHGTGALTDEEADEIERVEKALYLYVSEKENGIGDITEGLDG